MNRRRRFGCDLDPSEPNASFTAFSKSFNILAS